MPSKIVAAALIVSPWMFGSQAVAQISPEAAGEQASSIIRQQIFAMVPDEGPVDQNPTFAQFAAFVGREDLVAKSGIQGDSTCTPDEAGDPLDKIRDLAMKTSIVIINEDHGAPQHRAFVESTLHALRAQGYDHYAAETFLPLPELNGNLLYAHHGFYSREPIFGRAVQTAKKLGYRLVAYEASLEQLGDENLGPQAQIERRESAQAQNLYERLFKVPGKTKVVIHVGGAHAMEAGDQAGNRWMASRLKELTGVDPLTISQTACWSSAGASVAAIARQSGTERKSTTDDRVDLYVGHPRPQYKDNRPVWRRATGDIETPIPTELLQLPTPVIVEAHVLGDVAATVPMDRVLVRRGETIPLLLPPGTYDLSSYSASGKKAGPFQITVAGNTSPP